MTDYSASTAVLGARVRARAVEGEKQLPWRRISEKTKERSIARAKGTVRVFLGVDGEGRSAVSGACLRFR